MTALLLAEPEASMRGFLERQLSSDGFDVLALLDEHLATHDFFVGDRYTIADIAIYGYSHLAHEAGIDMQPHANLNAWFERVAQQPGHIDDVEPYGANAAQGAGRSLYG